jgi:hypothetical protein
MVSAVLAALQGARHLWLLAARGVAPPECDRQHCDDEKENHGQDH